MATKKHHSKQPANRLRCGNIKATIWENAGGKGPFFATTFSRPFKVEGVVTHMKSGLYTVRTGTGTNYTLAESVDVRYGRDVPKVGDEMILWLNDDNHIMDANRKGANLSPSFVSGKLVSINFNYSMSRMTLSMVDGEESFKLRPESRMFREMAIGTPVTIAVCKEEEVIDIHVDKDSEVPRSGLSHPDKRVPW